MNEIAPMMQRAVAALNQNDFQTARQLAERAANLQPGNAQILQILGIAQSQGGDPARGLSTLEKALKIAPNDGSLRFNAARAAFHAGAFEKVEKLAKPLGAQVASLHLRALASKSIGEYGASISLFEEALRQAPSDAELLNNYGNALVAAGQSERAIQVLSGAFSKNPGSAQIALNLGRAYTSAGKFDEAMSALRSAVSLAPQDGEILFELGKSLMRFSQHEEALPLLAEAARKGVRDPEVFILIGSAYSAMELREEAEKSLNVALSVDPKNIRAHVNMGLMLEQENRLEDLEELLLQAERKGLKGGDISYLRALLLSRQDKLDEALDLALSTSPEFLDEIIRQEFIGKTADRLGRYDVAFSAFETMNEAMSQMPEATKFDGTEHSTYLSKRVELLTDEWARSWPEGPPADEGSSPVFLGGFLRSGTTLLDTVLMSHPATHVREEEAMIARLEDYIGDVARIPSLTDSDIRNARDVYFNELASNGEMPEGSLLVDKYPLMTLRASFIHRVFPDAKYIFTLRHPCDVVLSCFMQNFRVTQAMASFLTIENAARLYDVVMKHWERAREVLPLNVHVIKYEDMVVDLEREMRPLIDFLQIEWDPKLLEFQSTARERGYIRTPSYAQVTEGLYTRSSGRWENYREQLEPILPVLAPWVEKFGYEPLDL
jgi:tetratricopeptide (TPR) repeat protein